MIDPPTVPGRTSLPALAALVVTALLLAGCEAGDPAATNSPTDPDRAVRRVVATTGMVTDIVRGVVGDRAEVIGLMGAGIDPHLYKPTRSDVSRLMDADVIFYSGLLLEGRMTDTFIRAATAGRRVHAVTESIDESTLLEPEEFGGHPDPHLWMDPRAWLEAVEGVRERMIEADPAGAEAYRENAAAVVERIEALDAYATRVLGSIPAERRVLVTAHDAFGYFGRRFGFEVVGIQGISTESEAGVKDIERIVDLLVTRRIGAVFVESTVSEKNIRALIAGARAQGHEVKVGGELYSDAMGPDGTYEGTYVGMIDHNVTTIARALGGDAPEGGLHGELTP